MAYTYARKKTSRRHWPKLLAGAVVFFPLSLTRVDFRATFGRGLAITTHHGSPAYAALEDLRADFGDVPNLAQSDLPPLELVRATDVHGDVRQLSLNGTVIRQPAPIEPSVVPERAIASVDESDLYADPDANRNVATVAHRLVQSELARSSSEQILASASGAKIIVRGQASAHPPRAALVSAAFRPKFATLGALATRPGLARAFWLDGQLEMTGGLAWTGPDVELVVRRTLGGRTLERGQIWVTEGRFEIHVSKPIGQLVAELQTKDGRVFGRGEINLLGIASATPRENDATSGASNRIGDLRIALRPTTEVASVSAISAYSHREHRLAVNDARVNLQSVGQALMVDDEGAVADLSLGRGSSYLARAEAPGHRPSLAVGTAEKPRDVRLLSNAMVDALVELERSPADRARAKIDGIIWGQVSAAGAPVAGATVELTAGLEPIYFNDLYLPDRSLTKTRANGLFAFLNVPSGVQAARVRRGERSYPAQVFAAEDQHVSVLDFDLDDDAVAQFRVVDALRDHEPRPAELRVVGTESRAHVTGDDAVTFATAGGTMLVEADAGPEFEISRTTMAHQGGDVDLPVVRRAWTNELFAAAREARNTDRGVVIGFIDDHDFEVEITGAVLNEKIKIVYFGRDGRPREESSGVAGGGFAILNAPAGLQTVTVRPTQARESFSQLVVAEPNLVSVLSWTPAH